MSLIEPSEALRLVIAGLPETVPVDRLDRVWVFPPKEIGARESGLVVLAALPEPPSAPDAPRRLLTLQYENDRHRPSAAPRLLVTEQGTAPPERIPRVMAGVVARLHGSDDPDEHAIAGSAARWRALLERYVIPVVDRGIGE